MVISGYVLYEITHGHLSRSETRSSYSASGVGAARGLMPAQFF